MATIVGPNNFTTFVSVNPEDPIPGATAWINPGNAVLSDDIYSTSAILANNQSQYLKSTGAGFSIPSNATITDIKLEVEAKKGAGAATVELFAALVVANAFDVTTELSMGTLSASDVYKSLNGTPTALGYAALTVAQVNATDFGFAVVAKVVDFANTTSIDHTRITLTYTVSGITKKTTRMFLTGCGS